MSSPPYAPSADRNKQPIADVLANFLPSSGFALEIASGTGQNIAWYADRFPGLTWQPTDIDPEALAAIPQWAGHLANVRAPETLDVTVQTWPVEQADVMICANMIHIAPWAAAEGLFAGAGRILSAGGWLFLYGPFKRDGAHTAPSNERFDESLRHRNPAWGIRAMEDVTALGVAAGLVLREAQDMPANNFTLIFEKT